MEIDFKTWESDSIQCFEPLAYSDMVGFHLHLSGERVKEHTLLWYTYLEVKVRWMIGLDLSIHFYMSILILKNRAVSLHIE